MFMLAARLLGSELGWFLYAPSLFFTHMLPSHKEWHRMLDHYVPYLRRMKVYNTRPDSNN